MWKESIPGAILSIVLWSVAGAIFLYVAMAKGIYPDVITMDTVGSLHALLPGQPLGRRPGHLPVRLQLLHIKRSRAVLFLRRPHGRAIPATGFPDGDPAHLPHTGRSGAGPGPWPCLPGSGGGGGLLVRIQPLRAGVSETACHGGGIDLRPLVCANAVEQERGDWPNGVLHHGSRHSCESGDCAPRPPPWPSRLGPLGVSGDCGLPVDAPSTPALRVLLVGCHPACAAGSVAGELCHIRPGGPEPGPFLLQSAR